MLADYSALSDQPEPEFAQTMITRFGVAVIPVSVFYREPLDRKVVRVLLRQERLDTAGGAAETRRAPLTAALRGLASE